MNQTFLSVVLVLQNADDLDHLKKGLILLGGHLQKHFSDYEIILVNNRAGVVPKSDLEALPFSERKNIYLINLSSRSNPNYATLAGLDRANGDYTVLLEFQFIEKNWVEKLYQKTQEGFDLVYLRAQNVTSYGSNNLFRKLFYAILKNYSEVRIDPFAHETRIISRRALNSLLRIREDLRFMKPVYSIIGYRSAFLQTEVPLPDFSNVSFREQFRTSLVAITSFTNFLRSVAFWIFGFSCFAVLGVIINAFKVKFTNYDLFGIYHEALSGWAFTVVIISVFFMITSLNFYIVCIYLSNIYQEIKKRPLYIIESVERF